MLSNIILGSIGNNMANESEDVFAVKDSLQEIGRFGPEPAPNGILTGDMDDALKGFQRDEGLKVDGIMKPAGETEQAMKGALAQRTAQRAEGLRKVIERSGVRTAQQPDSLSSLTQNILSQLREQNKPDDAATATPPLPTRKPLQSALSQLQQQDDEAGNATEASVARIKALQESRAEDDAEEAVAEAALEGKPVEFDATGRMIRPEASVARSASPINTEALIEQIKARQDANTKSLAETGRIAEKTPPKPRPKPALEPERKPVELDATGRMIRPEAAPDPASAPAPLPERKPEAVSFTEVPAYKKKWFESRRPEDEWSKWVNVLENDQQLSQTEKHIFRDIFAAEGGMEIDRPDSSNPAKSGIRQTTLNTLVRDGLVPRISAKHGKDPDVKKLNQTDLQEAYKAYFDDIFKGPGKTQGIPGSKILETIGDNEVASAAGDYLFREGNQGTDIALALQKAINTGLPLDKKIEEDDIFGSEIAQGLRAVAKDTQAKRMFLDALADFRNILKSGEKERNEYFRFKFGRR